MNNQPNPGSEEAQRQSCICPILDNAFGRGARGTSGENAQFWINENCPLHNPLKAATDSVESKI